MYNRSHADCCLHIQIYSQSNVVFMHIFGDRFIRHFRAMATERLLTENVRDASQLSNVVE